MRSEKPPTKIADLYNVTLFDENIRWLDVAVDDPLLWNDRTFIDTSVIELPGQLGPHHEVHRPISIIMGMPGK